MNSASLRYILFHHQTTTSPPYPSAPASCVISSFITKPQPVFSSREHVHCCVISSFITKPQPLRIVPNILLVALYPLSSPNHNIYAQHGITVMLRYILFHHQTTTTTLCRLSFPGCVISSFITKPQPKPHVLKYCHVALYPLSSPNHNLPQYAYLLNGVALYPLSSPNHNHFGTGNFPM